MKKDILEILPEIQKQPPDMFHKKGVLWNFAKFTGNSSVRVSFITKLQAAACKFIKKRLWHRRFRFPVNFAKFLRTFFLTKNLRVTASKKFRSSNFLIRIKSNSESLKKTFVISAKRIVYSITLSSIRSGSLFYCFLVV